MILCLPIRHYVEPPKAFDLWGAEKGKRALLLPERDQNCQQGGSGLQPLELPEGRIGSLAARVAHGVNQRFLACSEGSRDST